MTPPPPSGAGRDRRGGRIAARARRDLMGPETEPNAKDLVTPVPLGGLPPDPVGDGGPNPVASGIARAPVLDPLPDRADPSPDRDDRGGDGEDPPDEDKDGDRLETCPILPLGRYAGVYHYLTAHGEVMSFGHGQHSSAEIQGLFEGNVRWLYGEFPTYDKKQENIIGWSAKRAGAWMMRMCVRRGFYDPAERIRGAGVWRDAAGRLVLHCGDGVWTGGRWQPAGIEMDGYLYVAMPARPRPDFAAPAASDSAFDLLTFISEKWQWGHPAFGRLFFCWICSAIVGGALGWRPHLHVAGHFGTGKTWLQDLAADLMGVLVKGSEPSPAGIYQQLGCTNGPVALDEVEPDANSDTWKNVMKVVRLGSSDRQAPILRGSSDRRPVRYFIRAIFYLTGILHPEPLPQDRSRVTFLHMKELAGDTDPATIRARINEFAEAAPRLRARMILGWDRFQTNLMVISSALAKDKATHRYSDQVGALLAAGETMLHDRPLDEATARDLVKAVADAVADTAETDHEQCLRRLATKPLDEHKGGSSVTIGELIGTALTDPAHGEEARNTLRRHGIGFEPKSRAAEWIYFAQGHEGLESIFAGTRWRDNAWLTSLRNVPGARKGPKLSFAQSKCFTLFVPAAVFRDDGDAAAPDGEAKAEAP